MKTIIFLVHDTFDVGTKMLGIGFEARDGMIKIFMLVLITVVAVSSFVVNLLYFILITPLHLVINSLGNISEIDLQ